MPAAAPPAAARSPPPAACNRSRRRGRARSRPQPRTYDPGIDPRPPDRAYTDAELDAAVAAIAAPGRLQDAQDVVMRTAPSLQRVLAAALSQGGWFDSGHDQAVRELAAVTDDAERAAQVRTLLAEETRLGMLVGVAVGFELARELQASQPQPRED